MQRRFPGVVVVLFFSLIVISAAHAQQTDTTQRSTVDPELLAIPTAKTPKEYVIAGITVTGNQSLDASLLTSISGLNIGDKVQIPGGDNFSKAIINLWKQNLCARTMSSSDISVLTSYISKTHFLPNNADRRPWRQLTISLTCK
jgi:outer membrane protein insertion porin family